MAAGDQTPGRRGYEADVDWYSFPKEGDYWLDENTHTWYARVPGAPPGVLGNFTNHQITEHDDGSITISPSILVKGGQGFAWHGFLERGVWREL